MNYLALIMVLAYAVGFLSAFTMCFRRGHFEDAETAVILSFVVALIWPISLIVWLTALFDTRILGNK